jgi:small subunit ribosomal protein S21
MSNIQVKVRRHESVDHSLRQLKDALFWEGTIDEVRRLRAFETPKEKRVRKERRNARLAKMRKDARFGGGPTFSSPTAIAGAAGMDWAKNG